jgi:hypothetical protein
MLGVPRPWRPLPLLETRVVIVAGNACLNLEF